VIATGNRFEQKASDDSGSQLLSFRRPTWRESGLHSDLLAVSCRGRGATIFIQVAVIVIPARGNGKIDRDL
jgi:hypothetical protein